MSIEYDMDTLTSAKHNRAATEKFYKQVMPARTVVLNHDLPQMLHRSPSGAKRKIRQRAEEKGSRPSPFLQNTAPEEPMPPPPQPPIHQKSHSMTYTSSSQYSLCSTSNGSTMAPLPPAQLQDRGLSKAFSSSFSSQSSSISSSPSPAPSQIEDPPHRIDSYRRLIDSGGYRSILPELDHLALPASRLSSAYSSGSLNTSMAKVPSPSFEFSNTHYAAPVRTGLEPPVISPLKPTVEVHPMPAEERMIHETKDSSLKREKPAVPAKPKGLKISNDNNLPRSTSLSSLMVRAEPLSFNSPSAKVLSTLCASPSFVELHNAYTKRTIPENEYEKLEAKRNQSITVVDRRVKQLEEERGVVQEEILAIEETGEHILHLVESVDPELALKVRSQIAQGDSVTRLEVEFRLEADRLAQAVSNPIPTHSRAALMERDAYVKKRLFGINLLRQCNSRRENELDDELCAILHEEEQRLWAIYRENHKKIIQECGLIDKKIDEQRDQLQALQSYGSSPTSAPPVAQH
ncbi:unnamed protein product, partial [Mesorhabditis belari]|uniref:ASD2 domain-containing protein n=1 Tax=Mesorhabditis belari TaxID=2138241 RepID=A0AAF3E813_9BILA